MCTTQTSRRIQLLAVFLSITTCHSSGAAILFESGTLGPTGIPWSEFVNQSAKGVNINAAVFNGVRFELTRPSVTSQVGGNFVAPAAGSFFGAIVKLEDEDDFPDSGDLSTPDVLGHSLLIFPVQSGEVFGDLTLSLDPGWHALVFGSGLFGASGVGGAPLNNTDIDAPSYIGYQGNSGWINWFLLQNNKRFVVQGNFVPEPFGLNLLLIFCLCQCWRPRR